LTEHTVLQCLNLVTKKFQIVATARKTKIRKQLMADMNTSYKQINEIPYRESSLPPRNTERIEEQMEQGHYSTYVQLHTYMAI